jgi:hypothetical protein
MMMMQGVVARLLATRYDPTTRLHASRARLEDAYGRYRRVLLERRNLEAIIAPADGGGGLLEAAVDRKRADVADTLHLLARALAAHRRALVTVGGGAERSAA